MNNQLRKVIKDKVLFSREAAEYLGISMQRLNKLVHENQVVPIKKSSAGMIFLKDDLDVRNKATETIGSMISPPKENAKFSITSAFYQEVINYYTVQSFYNNSDKKTVPIFNELKTSGIDTMKYMGDIVNEVSCRINVDSENILKTYKKTLKSFEMLKNTDQIISKDSPNYPDLLREIKDGPPYIFARGNINLLKEKIVSVVGSRKASDEGLYKARKLAILLAKHNIVVASGLARGIDTAAHTGALQGNNTTIAVIGTPINKVYPKENQNLQECIERDGLVISQFPPSATVQRWNFPLRNAVMSGISLATVVVEAGETSGALKQADYALKQGRLLCIPQSALEDDRIKWPKKYIQKPGARKFALIDDLITHLKEFKIVDKKISEQMNLFDEE